MVRSFNVPEGDSKGHFVATFVPTEAMRQNGTGWMINGIGEGAENRNVELVLSNFVLTAGCVNVQ